MAVTGQHVSYGVVTDCAPSHRERVEVPLAIEILRERPNKAVRNSWPEWNGDGVECWEGIQLRMPEVLGAVDLENKMADGNRAYVGMNRIGGGKVSGKVSAM